MSKPVDVAKAHLDGAVETFRRLAKKAVDTAADPKSDVMSVTQARLEGTFALAAVGQAFKAALKLARPDDPAV